MKSICIALLLVLIAPAVAMTVEQEAYLHGVEDGTTIGSLFVLGKTHEDYAIQYNVLAQAYNDKINSSLAPEERQQRLLPLLPMPTRDLPPIFQQALINPWEGTSVQDLGTGPKLISNLSNAGGIEHKIDGGSPKGAAYTTNDMNLLPAKQTEAMMNDPDPAKRQGEYLGGV